MIISICNLCNYESLATRRYNLIDTQRCLGKPHRKNHPRHLGIALLAIAPPPPHSNGHSGALHLGKKCPKPSGQGSRPPQNEGNSSQKSCPKPSGQGFRPHPPPKRAMPKCLRYLLRRGFPNHTFSFFFTSFSQLEKDDK